VDIIASRLDSLGVGYCHTGHMDRASQYKFIVRLPAGHPMEATKKALAERGIHCGGGVYEVPCHLQPVFEGIAADKSALRVTEEWCPRHICPPVTSGTTAKDAHRIADALAEVLG
jgi:dTDP-4-amino-4,6-dideoxygalactose transaminase